MITRQHGSAVAGFMVTLAGFALVCADVRPAASAEPARFLVLDSRIIETVENAKLTLGTVHKHPGNPLFGEDKSWEVRFDNLYANVLLDDADGLYKCWYSPFIVDRSAKGMSIEQRHKTRYRPPRGRLMGVCYATSRDGLTWKKPALNLVEFGGSKANNLVLRGPHGAGVFKDAHASDAKRRYKMIHAGEAVRFSADGVHWSEPAPCRGIRSNGDTHNNMLWSPELKRYVAFVRLRDKGQRIVGRTESGDLQQWTRAVEVLRNNRQDQAYAMVVFPYENVYLGLVAIFRTREDRVHTELAWSPDTRIWHRIQPGTPFLANAPKEGDYDWGCVYAAKAPIVLADEIRIYYGGSNGKHTGWRDGFLCLARLRPDGWAGYEPVDRAQAAVVLTRPLPYAGEAIQVTADIGKGGTVTVSALDRDGKQLATAKPMRQTATHAGLKWDRALEANKVRLRFVLRDAKVYSFRFLAEPSPPACGSSGCRLRPV